MYVGIADFISFFFLIVSGIIIVLFPFSRVKLAYTIFSCLNSLFLGLVILASYFPSHTKMLIVIAMIGSGLAKCVLTFPYIIVSQYFDPSTEAHILNIWYVLLTVGEAISFFLNRVLIYNLSLDWKTVFAMWLGLVIVVSLIQHATVAEVYTEEQEAEERTVSEKLKEIREFLGSFLRKPIHTLLALDYVLSVSMLYNNILWIAYFFQRVGFGSVSPLIAMVFSIMQIPGLFGMEFLIDRDCIQARYITVILLFLNALCYVAVITVDLIPENSTLFLILFGLAGLFLGGPVSRTAASESTEVVKDNSRQKYLFLNFENAVKNIFNAFCMLAIGVMMEHIDVRCFLYVQLAVSVVSLGVHSARRVLESREEG